jgi:iron complex transport system substrate-binding protein
MKSFGLLIVWLMLLAAVPAQCGEPPRRIVSLAPSLTEMACALGLEQNLVGVTTFCDRPASVKGKPTVGGPANPSLEAVLRLKPDLVLVDEEGIGSKLAKRLQKLGVKTVTFRGSRFDRLVPAIRQLGNELGVPQAAERLAGRIEAGLRNNTTQNRQIRTLFVIWPDPLVAAGPGSLLDDVLQRIGFANIAEDARSGYPRLSLEAVIARNPQLIVVGQGDKLGVPLQRMLKHLSSLDAVRQGRVCMVSDALYRPGPRIPEGIAELKQCLELAQRGQRP